MPIFISEDKSMKIGRVFVTGARGQLGRDVCAALALHGMEYHGVDIDDFDLTVESAVAEAVASYRPSIIMHLAAYTSVDNAEDESETCFAANVTATRNVAEAARYAGAKLLYISTDYVFGGEGGLPFETDQPRDPRNVYGMTKSQGEDEVRRILPDRHFIVRISWVFGVHGRSNFVKTMLRLSDERAEVGVVCDQVGSPTYTADLAELLCEMVATDRYGTYHATNEGYCSWSEFAREIFAQSGRTTRVKELTTDQYPTKATRPMNSRLSKKSLDAAGFARLPDWRDALHRYLHEVYGEVSPCTDRDIPDAGFLL
jgi:dTDP-4-dehydrorhamnose reductase